MTATLDWAEHAARAFEPVGVFGKLGYEPNGTTWATRRGSPCELQRWTLTRAKWETAVRTDIEVRNVQGCLPLLGLD